MNGSSKGIGWGGRLLIGLALLLAGAAAATWALARYEPAARLLGVAPRQSVPPRQPVALAAPQRHEAVQPSAAAGDVERIANLEARLARVESATQRAQGSAGRADALVIAFAARRAIDRGVALGYLENLLAGRFGRDHRAAVATIITAARNPVRLDELIAGYQQLGPELRSGSPQESWWSGLQRELGALVQVHRADRPSTSTDAVYNRALSRLEAGEVDQALAETMRLPGAAAAADWAGKARRYIAVHRALDEIESAALLPRPDGRA